MLEVGDTAAPQRERCTFLRVGERERVAVIVYCVYSLAPLSAGSGGREALREVHARGGLVAARHGRQ